MHDKSIRTRLVSHRKLKEVLSLVPAEQDGLQTWHLQLTLVLVSSQASRLTSQVMRRVADADVLTLRWMTCWQTTSSKEATT